MYIGGIFGKRIKEIPKKFIKLYRKGNNFGIKYELISEYKYIFKLTFSEHINLIKNNNEEMWAASRNLVATKLKLKQLPLQEKLVKHDFDWDVSDFFGPLTNTVGDTSKKNWTTLF